MGLESIYGNKVRVRCCGICTTDEAILLINHSGLQQNDLWLPPGGGVELGEPAEACLIREFLEETGLSVEVGEFLFACEFIQHPLHAIEFFFNITNFTGKLTVGKDPEMGDEDQLFMEARFMRWDEIKSQSMDSFHRIFGTLADPSQIKQLRGYFKV